MPNYLDNKLFNDSIIIESQFVKIIQLFTPLGGDFDFDSDNIELDFKYKILDNKENNRDHIVILEFSLNEKEKSEQRIEESCHLTIVVEGIYKINEKVPDDEIKSAKHFGSLNLLVNYLRTVYFNITSMSANGGQLLPLINLHELHKKNIKPKRKTTKANLKNKEKK